MFFNQVIVIEEDVVVKGLQNKNLQYLDKPLFNRSINMENNMKIAIATESGNVAQHFGRCMEYTIVDVIDKKITNQMTLPNPGHEPGAIPKFLNSKGCNLIIAGGMGRRAQAFFEEFNIEWIIGATGKVNNVIEEYINDTLVAGESSCTHGEGHGDGTNGYEHCDH
jgi:predicted Fe-Mo cluster-binding NifX family protein